MANRHAEFVGREYYLRNLKLALNSHQSITLVVGESGIGKSALLNEFYNLMKNENIAANYFVGFHNEEKAKILGAPQIYPFVSALESMLVSIKESQQPREIVRSLLTRTVNALKRLAEDKGKELSIAIVQSITKQIGFDWLVLLSKDFLEYYKEEDTALMLADEYVEDHKKEAIFAYINILKHLAREFNDRKFVLIFDQFEYAGKASLQFLVNMINQMPNDISFHTIIAFKTEERIWSDIAANKLYEDAKNDLLEQKDQRLRRKLQIEGMSVEEIGKWIKLEKNINLPLHNLKRIRENSAGFPIILKEWITQSQNLDYNEIKRVELCNYIFDRRKSLGKNKKELLMLDKMSVLVQPPKDEHNRTNLKEIAKFLDTEFEELPIFIDELVQKGLFDKITKWFKHELIQKCLEDRLRGYPQIYLDYHAQAAKHYKNRYQTEKNDNKNIGIDSRTQYAYHLHEAGMHEKSYEENKSLAKFAYKIGNFDLAERCYRRAICDAMRIDKINEETECIFYLSRILYVWGRYDQAADNYNYLLNYCIRNKDSFLQSKVLYGLSEIYMTRGKFEEAYRTAKESLSIAINRELGKNGKSLIISDHGDIQYLDKAEISSTYEDKLTLKRHSIDQLTISATAFQMGNSEYILGNYGIALEWYYNIFSIPETYSNPIVLALTLHQIADITNDQKKYDEAVDKYKSLLDEYKNKHPEDKLSTSIIKHQLANIHYRKKNYQEAEILFKESMQIAREMEDDVSVATTLHQIGNIYYLKGSEHIGALTLHNNYLSNALRYYDESLSIKHQNIGEEIRIHDYGIAASLGQKGKVLIKKNEYENALPYILQAHSIFTRYYHPDSKISQHDINLIKDIIGITKYERIKKEMINI